MRKGAFWDDVHGVMLNERMVQEARTKEMKYFRSMEVYEKVSKRECWEKTGKAPIMVRCCCVGFFCS